MDTDRSTANHLRTQPSILPELLHKGLKSNSDDYANAVVERLLQTAASMSASDIHLSEVTGDTDKSVACKLRVHGQLISLPAIPDGTRARILSRIKALARLVTYRNDIPQEGRFEYGNFQVRVGTLPILGGERVVIRLQRPEANSLAIDQLGLATEDLSRLQEALSAQAGVIAISGPAGSGKTTTAYACLRGIIAQQNNRSIVSLEDPVECTIGGVDQSQINAEAGYSWELGLKSVLRQDPEVLLIGEIRDDSAAQVAFKAATTGQLVITTLHARSAADALCRLLEMGVPAHQIRSSLLFLNCQRLLPKQCECKLQRECKKCNGAGVLGQTMRCETVPSFTPHLVQRLNATPDMPALHEAMLEAGMHSLSSYDRTTQ